MLGFGVFRIALLMGPPAAGSRKIRSSPDSSVEGSGFELPVPRCALIANGAALVAPPDSVVSGGSLNGRLTTPIGLWAGNCSAAPRGSIGPTGTRPRTLVIGRRRTASH